MKRTISSQGLGIRSLFPVNPVSLYFANMSLAILSVSLISMVLIWPVGLSQARDVATVKHSNPTASLKTIIVGDYYPYTFVNDKGVPDGFSVDVAKAVASVMGLNLDIRVDIWEHATRALSDGTIDLLPMMAYSHERDKIFDFSAPHTIAYDAVFSRGGAQKIRSLKDLNDKTVIVMNKDAAHQYLLASGLASKMKLILVDSLPDALRTLATGKGDAALMPKLVGLIIMNKLNLTNLDHSPVVIDAYNRPFSFAVKDGNQALLERLSQGLSIIKSTGQYKDIYNKWFGALEPPALSWKTVIQYISVIVVVFLFIAVGLILWTVSLRKQVSLRTKYLADEIQERERVAEELRSSAKDLRESQRIAHLGSWRLNVATNQVVWSEELYKMYGFDPALPPPPYTEHMKLFARGSWERLSTALANTRETGIPYELELEIVRKDGSNGWMWVRGETEVDSEGKTVGIWGAAQDITERKQAEEALLESETKLQAIFDTVGTGIIIIHKETQVIIDANQTAIEMTELPKEKVIGQICHSLFCPAQVGKCPVKDLGQTVDHSERKLLYADGRLKDILKTVFPITIKGQDCYLESFIDISDLKRAEEGLRHSKQQITDIIEFLPDATLAIDNDKRIIIWNRAIEEMTGIPAKEMIGKGDYAYTIPFYGEARPQLMDLVFEDRDEIANRYPQITREGDNLMAEVFCNALYDNKGAWVYAKSTPLRDQDGNVKGAIEIIRDITEQKRYENALKDYQRNLADVINFLPDATFVIDKDGIVTAWNNAMVSMTGIKAEEMIGKGNYEYAIPFYGERRPIIIDLILSENEEFLKKSYDAINYQESVLSGEVYVPETFGGKGAYLWGNASRLYNASGEVIGAIQSIRDITDRKQAEAERRELEERLQRAEKMESLGTLAGGVAHDLNNVLGIVVGYAEMLMDELDEANPMRDDLEKILEGGNRSAAIVQDLLTLARRGVQTKKTVNLNATVMDCQKLPEFEKIVSHNRQVKLQTDLESDLLNIIGSPVHLAKSIINLVANAVEAMPDGGVLKIDTANQYLDIPIQGYDKIREGDYVVLTVSDTGEGILERDIKRIFEPFYTKKIMGRSGTGLGLAVVWGTVKDHNGYINVESTEGKGTTFTLYFPVTRDEMAGDLISVSLSEYLGRGETILVVDDINRQRELASRMLTKLNYIVSTVASGEEAIEYLKENKADLIVLDMIMDPGIDGLETYEKVLENNPVQKAIIVSGFSESDRVKEAQKIGAGAYVPKPYVLERLGMAVRKELDRK